MVEALSTVRCAAPETPRVNKVNDPWERTDVLVNVSDCVDFYSDDTDSNNEGVTVAAATATVSGGSGRRNVVRRGPAAAMPDQQTSALVDDDLIRLLNGCGNRTENKDGETGVI